MPDCLAGLEPLELKVYVALCRFGRRGDVCRPSDRTIASSRRVIQRFL